MARPRLITIGYAGEHDARNIRLDISDLQSRWPNTLPSISVMRPEESTSYLAANISFGNGYVMWTFDGYDAELEGDGYAQILMSDSENNILGKSERIVTHINESNQADSAPQEWHEGFEARIAQKSSEAIEAAQDAALVLDEMKQKIASGDLNGKDGVSPRLSVERTEIGIKVTAVDIEGTTTAEIKDGAGKDYDDTAIKQTISELQANKADKSEIPAPYDDTSVKHDIADLRDKKADKSQIPDPYNDTELKTDIQSLKRDKADRDEIPSPYDDTVVKADIKSLQDNKADKSEIPAIYDDTELRSKVTCLETSKQNKLVAGNGVTIDDDGTISAGSGSDIIQDPDDPSGGIVAQGTLANIDGSLSLANHAADAKVVGDKIADLVSNYKKLVSNLIDKGIITDADIS